MNNEIKFSATLEEVYEIAEYYKTKYRSSRTSTLHALLAILNMFFNHPEIEETSSCVSMLNLEQPQLEAFLSELNKHIMRHRLTSESESLAYAEACALSAFRAENAKDKFFTTNHLMVEILKDPMSNIKLLKEKIARQEIVEPEKIEQKSSEQEVFSSNNTKIEDDIFEDMLFEDLKNENSTTKTYLPLPELVAETNRIQTELLNSVYGQDEAVSAFVSGFFNGESTASSRKNDSRPLATFLFAGAPGVGKTFLAESAAKQLKRPFKRFDMSGFADKEAPLSFAGCDKVFKSAHPGLVTDFVAKNPECVILFDEIEKAHQTIIHLFLQILDAGKLKDSYTGEDVSFKNAIIIMTTNVGRALYENDDQSFSKSTVSRKVLINALSTEKNPQTEEPYFPSAICSRFAAGNILLFNPLTALDLIHIAERRLFDFCDSFAINHEISISFDQHVGPALLFSEGCKVDARSLKGRADTFISGEVFKWLKFAHAKDVEQFKNLLALSIEVDLENGGEAAWLFEDDETPNILLFSEREQVFDDVLCCEGYNFFVAKTMEEVAQTIAKDEIDFVICDIIHDRAEKTLNIEDTSSTGRKLFDLFVREEIPFYVFTEHKNQINLEERQALLEQKAHGFFECYTNVDVDELLEEISYQTSCESKLLRLGRANKVLTFDCNYEWRDDEIGLIRITGLRVSPAIDAEDKKEFVPIDVSNVTFDQIIGAEDVKSELKSFISFLQNPKDYARYGIPAPKGILLYGPPGTGKTMLAKALAQEAGTAFIATEGNAFLKSVYGQASASVHSIFKKARKYAPCILFIDEIDAIAMNRMTGGSQSANEALNALLNEMDGFSTNPNKPVFVLAATNFDASFGKKGELDPAVLRRFDRRIFVDLPNKNERKVFMKERLARSKQTLDDDTLDNFATRSVGMSLAELSQVVDFALRSMLRFDESVLTSERLNESFETFCFGEEHQKNQTAAKRVALHEAGHAFVSWHFGSKPNYITISSRGSFGGYAHIESNDSLVQTADDLKASICAALAGRAAETVFYGKNEGVSTGAANDLKVATTIALGMITEFGMSEQHGLMSMKSDEPDEDAIKLCNALLDEQFDIAIKLIEQNKEVVSHLAESLVEKNHLTTKEIDKILKN